MSLPSRIVDPASVASILLVDDHPPNLLALEAILEPLGQRLVRAVSGEQALQALATEDFAVVLLDVQMGFMNGFETARRAKQIDRARHVPIIFISAQVHEDAMSLMAYAEGAVDYVTKPLSPDIIRAKVAVFVELFRKSEQIKLQQLALQATELLATSLDYETTLQNMARLAVPALADWCALDMVAEDGTTKRLAVQHMDPEKIAFVEEIEKRYPPDLNAQTGVPQVIRTGKSEWMAEIPDALLEAGAKDAEHLRIIRELALRSYIAVPIAARGRVLGVLSLVMAESNRRYTERDLHLAEDLAARAALFVENSRLFRESTQARQAAETLTRDLKTSEEKFRAMARAIPQQVWTATPEGGLDFVNERVSAYFDRPQEMLLGDGWATGVHPEDGPLCLERWTHALKTGEPYEVEFRLRRADGAYRWHLAQALPSKDESGQITKWFGSNTDIDDRKRTEQEREHLIAQLERTNAELDQFAYVASHDLKAPLRGIANLSQWIEEDLGPQMSDESRRQMELLRGRVHRLEALIDGILNYSRAGRTPTTPEPVQTQRLLQDVVELVAPPEGVTVQLSSELPSLHAEKVPLQQVFMNLLTNAIKHGGTSQTKISVSSKDAGAFWQFSISDNGPGIAPEYHDKIWGIFQTLQARDRVEGTGIGLAVVRKIVQSKGGRAWVESSEGRGAIFYFTWPKRASEAHTHA